MSKIYFSRSITRSMSADHPVGDPTGGAAYGEKNDPVSAILSVAAMGASYAPMMAGSIMAGVTFAGAAVGLVGNVTGNKTLSKIGMVAGVVGGLGQMGAFGEAAKGATWKDIGMGGGSAATATAPVKDAPLSQTPSTELANERAVQQRLVDANKAGGMQTVGAGGQTAPPDYLKGPAAMKPTDYSLTSGAANIRPADGIGLSVGGSTAPAMQLNANQPGIWDTLKKGNLWEATKMAGSNVMDFAKENPYGALAIGQIAQPIAEYLSGKTDAEIAALEAQTGYADAGALRIQEEIAKEKRRRENLNAGYAQVNTGINVNPNASMAQQGLIAQQLQQA